MSGLARQLPSHKNSPVAVSVVGATGLVGRELVFLLEKRKFPIADISFFSSGKKREDLFFRWGKIAVKRANFSDLKKAQLVFFASSDEVSRRWAKKLAGLGIWVIDDSSAFRDDPLVPLVIPEVNADAFTFRTRLIAGPNCTMTGLAVAGNSLHKKIGISEIRLASYQAVSGAGRAAINEFFDGTRKGIKELSLKSGRVPILKAQVARDLPAQIFGNVFPQVGAFDGEGNSVEEIKIAAELRKIWKSPKLSVSSTAVRVPTLRGHCLAVWLTLKKNISLERAREILASSVVLESGNRYATPISCAGKENVFAARLRRGCSSREIVLWIVADNLLKGAALNSIQIAEEILSRGWFS